MIFYDSIIHCRTRETLIKNTPRNRDDISHCVVQAKQSWREESDIQRKVLKARIAPTPASRPAHHLIEEGRPTLDQNDIGFRLV